MRLTPVLYRFYPKYVLDNLIFLFLTLLGKLLEHTLKTIGSSLV